MISNKTNIALSDDQIYRPASNSLINKPNTVTKPANTGILVTKTTPPIIKTPVGTVTVKQSTSTMSSNVPAKLPVTAVPPITPNVYTWNDNPDNTASGNVTVKAQAKKKEDKFSWLTIVAITLAAVAMFKAIFK